MGEVIVKGGARDKQHRMDSQVKTNTAAVECCAEDSNATFTLTLQDPNVGKARVQSNTLIFSQVSRQEEWFARFSDCSKGPVLSDFKDMLIKGKDKNKEVTLDSIVQLVVATIRVIPPQFQTGMQKNSKADLSKAIYLVKERMNKRLHDSKLPSSLVSNPRKRRRVGEIELVSESDPEQEETGISHNTMLFSVFDGDYAFGPDHKSPLISIDRTTFSHPLKCVVREIADALCIITSVIDYPIPIQSYNLVVDNPLAIFKFPLFAISETLYKISQKKDDLDNPFLHPKEEFYKPVVDHVRNVLCGGDVKSYKIIESWLAELFFDPMCRYPVCPVFTGPQGIGKNIFFEFITTYILGKALGATPFNLDQFTQRFNSLLKDKLLLVMSEENLNNPNQIRILKMICSEDFQCIEEKFEKIESNVKVYARVCILTNDPDPYSRLPLGERRFVVIKTGSEVPDPDYLKSVFLTPERSPTLALHYLGYLNGIRQMDSKKMLTLKCMNTEGESSALCNCEIPHRYYHSGGYNTSIMRKDIMTRGMACKYIQEMDTDRLFLLLFIVCRMPMLQILGDSKMTDTCLTKHNEELGDLMCVKQEYIMSASALFRKHFLKPSYEEDRSSDIIGTYSSNLSISDYEINTGDVISGFDDDDGDDGLRKQGVNVVDRINKMKKGDKVTGKRYDKILDMLKDFIGFRNTPRPLVNDESALNIKYRIGNVYHLNISGVEPSFKKLYGNGFGLMVEIIKTLI